MNSNPHIPERFRRAIVLHVVKNNLSGNTVRMPLLLGIHGPSGDGKTYQCERVLEEMGAKAFLISGGQLESHEAGEPAKLIRNTYLNASRCIEHGDAATAVVLMNDIDTGVGSWGELVQYTINRQTVFGELMHLVDYPTSVEGRITHRIPIIMTGNDFTKLYEPLVRAGRMEAFEWKPTREEKAQIISRIFPELSLPECSALVDTFEREPLAFFSALRSTLTDDDLYREIERVGIQRIIAFIRAGHEPEMNPRISYDRLVKAGTTFIKSGQLANHLRKA